MSSFAGYILHPNFTLSGNFEELFESVTGIKKFVKITGTEWYSFTLTSQNPISEDDIKSNSGLYEYPFVARWGGKNFIFTANTKEVATFFVEKFMPSAGKSFRKQGIDVDGFVRKIAEHPSRFTLTYLNARVYTWGAALRSVSLFGEDITASGLLLENIKNLNFNSCGVGEASSPKEIVKIGTNGSLNFFVYGVKSYNAIDKVLKYLKFNGFYLED
jgi:hypothetical protein